MYLIITPMGDILKAENILDGDLELCDDGFIQIVDTRGPSEYIDGKWQDMDVWG